MEELTLRSLIEAMNSQRNQKAYYSVADIMERYDCSHVTAEKYMREMKALSGGKLGKGKVLPSELALWEHHINGRDMRERMEHHGA